MMLIRKITRAKWQPEKIIAGGKVPADAITIDSKTQSNTLSLWKIDSRDELDDGVLAILLAQEKIETLDVILMEFDKVEKSDLVLKPTDGRTPYISYRENHMDLVDMTYESLGTYSEIMRDSFKSKMVRKYTLDELNTLLKNRININNIDVDQLNPKMKNKLEALSVI